MSDKLIKMLTTWFYIGNSPFAPGSMASIAGAVMAIVLMNNLFLYFVVLIAVTVVGLMISGRMEKIVNKKDPGCVVIDEISGVMISYFLLPVDGNWNVIIATFFLFRAFDMFKIWPVNKFEDIGGGTGIMMDDVMAGVYTNIIMQIAVRWAGII
ncbi:MAG: phosphatidylglycerophosphatase A [Candidatus Omnitrophota bacterium]|jgi:phosphatidylglycerophosphatase A